MPSQSVFEKTAGVHPSRDEIAIATGRAIERFTAGDITRLELVDELLRIDRLNRALSASSSEPSWRRLGRAGRTS
jgi:hypothetical protein